ncbi:ParA family protein [Rhodococcus sp. NPDC003382]|uniref:ParA family protein n=1 Tax=Rhodococcus sp. HM1 TaxID=2937759 RepID=UPI00200A8E88|nr:AAA family ATPase [Rhodococcus sp. HM1]MCK8673923.1 AAA family ATPase [Rhodococcus sp. HM1]
MSATVIYIGNEKGGVGKTTTVLNVGEALARAGAKVLLVDMDNAGHLSHTLTKSRPELRTNAAVTTDHIIEMRPEVPRKPAAEAIIEAVRPGVDLIAAPTNDAYLTSAEKYITDDPIDGPFVLREALQPIRDRYDYILLDCSPTRNALEMAALVASDQLIVVNEPIEFSVLAMQKMTAFAQKIKKRQNAGLWVRGTILNRLSAGTQLAKKWTAKFDEAGIPVLGMVRTAEVIKKAVEDGVSLADVKDGWRNTIDYDDIASAITQRKKS